MHEKDSATRGFSIGEAAKASGLSAKTIRYYEQIGLIPKAPRRASGAPHTGGDRVYCAEDIGRLRFIRHARLVDLSLSEIRELLTIADQAGCPSKHSGYRELLKRHLRRIDERINHLIGLRGIVHSLLQRQEGQPMDNDTCTWATCTCMAPAASRSPRTDITARDTADDVPHESQRLRKSH